MDCPSPLQKTQSFISSSASFKAATIGALVLLLLIPIFSISSLVREREARRNEVINEINQKWGGAQTITGPYLTVPYAWRYEDENQKSKVRIRHLHILPQHLSISGQLAPQLRSRGIYEAVLYTAELTLSGDFNFAAILPADINPQQLIWKEAELALGLSDLRGIQESVDMVVNGVSVKADPGLKTTHLATSGVKIPLAIDKQTKELSFSVNIKIRGSEAIRFIPLGKETVVQVQSSWPSPSFDGAFLPEKREVNQQGFTASWKVLHLNRNFPQSWLDEGYPVGPAAFGLRLIIPADIYQKSSRIAKYALMFIVFTFSAFFCSEMVNKQRLHPIQYLLIGLAVALFYVLLLSIAEHLGFNLAYLIAALAVTALISLYSQAIIKNRWFSFTVFGLLSVLYGYFYIVLQLEDYALLMGSIGLFAVLGAIMFITRNLNWYVLHKKE